MKALSYLLGFGLVALSLSACGGSTTGSNGSTASTCAAGQTQTTNYGCLSQGSCSAGYLQTPSNGCLLTSTLTGASATTCTVAGQISTTSGCITPTGGACTVPGTNAQGVIFNNQCVQVTTGGNTGMIIPSCQLYSTDGLNSCLTYSPSCNYGYGISGGTQTCTQGSPRPKCSNGLQLEPVGNSGQYACVTPGQLSPIQGGFGPGGYNPGQPGSGNYSCSVHAGIFYFCSWSY